MQVTNLITGTILEDLMNLAKTYADETLYEEIEFSSAQAYEFLYNSVYHSDCALFVEYIGNEIAGAIIVHRKKEFTTRYFGFILKFYVMPDCRGTETSRKLMQQAIDWFDTSEVVYSYIAPAGMIGQDQLFINLLKKYGYIPNNPSYMRKGNNGNRNNSSNSNNSF